MKLELIEKIMFQTERIYIEDKFTLWSHDYFHYYAWMIMAKQPEPED